MWAGVLGVCFIARKPAVVTLKVKGRCQNFLCVCNGVEGAKGAWPRDREEGMAFCTCWLL